MKQYNPKVIGINQDLFSKVYPYPDSGQLSKAILHLLIGQLPNTLLLRYNIGGSQLDLRTHLTILAPSGTNKGSMYNYVASVSSALSSATEKLPKESQIPMHLKMMGEFTDGALVGWVDKEYEEGEKVEVQIPGELHPIKGNNILGWSEATDVLDASKFNHNKHTLNTLQKAMNSIGTADNLVSKMSGMGEIAYNTSVSLFLTTYKPPSLKEDIIGTGFLQRQYVLIHTPSLQESRDVAFAATDNLTSPIIHSYNFHPLIEQLQIINTHIGTITKLNVSKEMQSLIKDVQKSFYSVIQNANLVTRQKLGEFVRRWSVNILYNTIFHHTLMRLSSSVNEHDILYAKNFLLPIWVELAAFLESTIIIDSKEAEVINATIRDIVFTFLKITDGKQDKPIERHHLINTLSTQWGLSTHATKFRLSNYESDIFKISHIDKPLDTVTPMHNTQTLITLNPNILDILL